MADRATRSNRPSEEVRRDIEHTLSQMDATVDALADKLSPERLIDQAWERLRGGTDEGIGRVVREHPIPVALVGVGLGWLAVEQATEGGNGHTRGDGDPTPRATTLTAEETRERSRERYAGSEEPGPGRDEDDEGAGLLERAGDAAASAGDRARAKASEAAEGARDLSDRATDAVSDAVSRVRGQAGDARQRARAGFWELLEENPLALGAVAFGVGLASGISVPTTRAEDRVMGRTSDALESEARRVGRETAEKAKHVAKDAVEAAASESDRMVDAAREAAWRRSERRA